MPPLPVNSYFHVRPVAPSHEEYSRLRNRGMETIKALTAISRKVCGLVFALARDKRFFSQEAPQRMQKQKAA